MLERLGRGLGQLERLAGPHREPFEGHAVADGIDKPLLRGLPGHSEVRPDLRPGEAGTPAPIYEVRHERVGELAELLRLGHRGLELDQHVGWSRSRT